MEVGLYLPGTQAVQTPSSKVDPVNVDASVAEALLKLTPIGQVALVMFAHPFVVMYVPAVQSGVHLSSLIFSVSYPVGHDQQRSFLR